MDNKTTEMVIGKSVEISAETSAAIKKLPKAVRSIAESISKAEQEIRDRAASAVSSIQKDALALEKQRAAQIAVMSATYDMKAKDAPFTSWGDFARAAWNRSPAWWSINRAIGAIFVNADESETIARQIAKDYTLSQMQEMLPLCYKKTDKISPRLATAIANGEISPDMPATGEDSIRDFVQAQGAKKEQKEKSVDILIPANNERFDNVMLSAFAPSASTDIQFRLNFDPKTTDTEKGDKPFKGIVLIQTDTFKPQVILYHAHVAVQESAADINKRNATERAALAIREIPERFRMEVLADYKEREDIDYSRLCLILGVSDTETTE